MKWIWIIIIIGVAIYLFNTPVKNKNPYETETSSANVVTPSPISQTKSEDCVSPENPYDEGGGHYAGFEWEAENGYQCDGNSESFNEGCEEYARQLNSYNSCLNQNK